MLAGEPANPATSGALPVIEFTPSIAMIRGSAGIARADQLLEMFEVVVPEPNDGRPVTRAYDAPS